MKKIIFVITSLGPGGAERVFANILNRIDKDKFDVTLAIGVKKGPFLSMVPEGVNVVELSGSNKASKSVVPLLRLIYKIKPDIVFSTLGMVSSSSLCSFFVGKKIRFIARFGNTLSADLNRVKKESFFKYIFQKCSYKLVLLRSEIVTQSSYMKNDMIHYFNYKEESKIHVIYNPAPIPVTRIKSKVENRKVKLISVGRFSWQKGYDILLDALKIVIDNGYNIDFKFIGDGDDKNSLVKQCERLEIIKYVSFSGFQKQPFVFAHDADIFISSSRFEGFANVIVESLANGIPVVATDCPSGNREIINDGINGWLSSMSGDVTNNLASTIMLAIDSYKDLDMECEKSKVLDKFSIESIVNDYESIFLGTNNG